MELQSYLLAQWQSGRVAGSSEAGGDRGREAGGLGGSVAGLECHTLALWLPSYRYVSVEESLWRVASWKNGTEAGSQGGKEANFQ